METRNCQNCKKDFNIEPDDFSFYEKIKVPAPTFCPECRMMRRVLFRNVRSLYKRECVLCHKTTVAMYPPEDHAPIYCNECWKGDGWDALDFGLTYSDSVTFFERWYELFKTTPRFPLWKVGVLVNSEYTNFSLENKNCYLIYSALRCEDTRYSESIDDSRNSLDCYQAKDLEFCYENVDSIKNYNSIFLKNCRNCIDSHFLFDCSNCQNCFMSANLRNSQYVFRGQQLSKEDYKEALKEENLGSFSSFENLKKEFSKVCQKSIHKHADFINAIDSTGDHIFNARNVKNCFSVYNVENVKHSIRVPGGKEVMDVYGVGEPAEFMYESVACSFGSYMNKFSILCESSQDIEYSFMCNNCSNIFGCIGLKNKSYCILNKQYTKEQYEDLVFKIKLDMVEKPFLSKNGIVYRYGEFFPIDFSPHPYNRSLAIDIIPCDKNEVQKMGIGWADESDRDYKITKASKELPDNILEVTTDISKEVIKCSQESLSINQCTVAYRILPEDIDFYKKMNLPLPHLCPNCRHYDRFLRRNPFKLWHRSCMCEKLDHGHVGKCQIEFETSYAPDRPEVIYCEQCYQQEVL